MSGKSMKIREKLIQSGKMTALGKTVRGVAHEVNNLIAVISANGEYLLGLVKKEKFSPDVVDSLEAIQEYSTRAGKITQGLLNFSREETEPQRANINNLIETTLSFMEKQLEKENIKLITNFALSVPEIIGNRSQLQQVFLNLILNAIDAMPKGGCLTIATGAKGEKFIEVTFEDTGYGIPKDKIKRIFSPNFTTKERGEGSGLGLPICYEIVNRHFGEIKVKSRKIKGTAISLRFPIKQS